MSKSPADMQQACLKGRVELKRNVVEVQVAGLRLQWVSLEVAIWWGYLKNCYPFTKPQPKLDLPTVELSEDYHWDEEQKLRSLLLRGSTQLIFTEIEMLPCCSTKLNIIFLYVTIELQSVASSNGETSTKTEEVTKFGQSG